MYENQLYTSYTCSSQIHLWFNFLFQIKLSNVFFFKQSTNTNVWNDLKKKEKKNLKKAHETHEKKYVLVKNKLLCALRFKWITMQNTWFEKHGKEPKKE